MTEIDKRGTDMAKRGVGREEDGDRQKREEDGDREGGYKVLSRGQLLG